MHHALITRDPVPLNEVLVEIQEPTEISHIDVTLILLGAMVLFNKCFDLPTQL